MSAKGLPMKTITAISLGAVVVSGSMLAASRASVAPDSSLFAATQSAPAAVAFTQVNVVPMDSERVLRDQTVLQGPSGPAASSRASNSAYRISGRLTK